MSYSSESDRHVDAVIRLLVREFRTKPLRFTPRSTGMCVPHLAYKLHPVLSGFSAHSTIQRRRPSSHPQKDSGKRSSAKTDENETEASENVTTE